MQRTTARLPFLLAVALVAAALGNALVETIANSGAVGAGYSDDNHASVLPTLLCGGLAGLELLRRRCLALLRRGDRGRRGDWIVEFARRSAPRVSARDLAAILSVQLVALYLMESAEHLLFGGKLSGGSAWLGGPVAFSLAVHALVGAGCALALAWFGRTMLSGLASLIGYALEALIAELTRDAWCSRARGAVDAPRRRVQAPPARQIGDRAPPQLSFA